MTLQLLSKSCVAPLRVLLVAGLLGFAASPASAQTLLTITTDPTLPFGNVGVPYSQSLAASGGSGALTWTLAPNNFLPPGLTLLTDGVLNGMPTGPGQFYFAVNVAEGSANVASFTFNLAIYPSGDLPPLSLNIIWTDSPASLHVGDFTLQLSASGGNGIYTFSLTPDSDFPPGAVQIPGMRVQNGPPFPTCFRPSTTADYMGVIAAPGEYYPSIRVTDSRGVYFDRVTTVTVPSLMILSSYNLPDATIGIPYSFTMEPYGGSNYSWAVYYP